MGAECFTALAGTSLCAKSQIDRMKSEQSETVDHNDNLLIRGLANSLVDPTSTTLLRYTCRSKEDAFVTPSTSTQKHIIASNQIPPTNRTSEGNSHPTLAPCIGVFGTTTHCSTGSCHEHFESRCADTLRTHTTHPAGSSTSRGARLCTTGRPYRPPASTSRRRPASGRLSAR